MNIDEQRAKDAIVFDGFPNSRWVLVKDDHISVRVPYSEPLSALLRSIGNGSWCRDSKEWKFQFAAAPRLSTLIARIDALASAAYEAAEVETKRRDEVRERRAAERSQEPEPQAHVFRNEFIERAAGTPLHALSLESIGDDMSAKYGAFGFKPRAWVAQVFGIGADGRPIRTFIRGSRDYAKSNSKGSRGVILNFTLCEGPIYEISEPISWSSTNRYFIRYSAGVKTKFAQEDLYQCLAK